MEQLIDLNTATTHLSESYNIRRYFKKFSNIINNFKKISRLEVEDKNYEYYIMIKYLELLKNSFNSLSMKYLFSDVVNYKLPSRMIIDSTESGFPNSKLIIEMEGDLLTRERVLNEIPTEQELKEDLVSHILRYKTAPNDIQFSLSQQKYYTSLEHDFFRTFNFGAFELVNQEDKVDKYVIDWATYDGVTNLPYVYLMEIEDTSGFLKIRENKDKLIQLLKAESISTLKTISIATSIDESFDFLHPKSLKRIQIGPVFSNAYTEHNEVLTTILSDCEVNRGYIFNWTIEHILSEKQKQIDKGFFGTPVKRESFLINPYDMKGVEKGVTDFTNNYMLPHELYQKAVANEDLNEELANSQIYTVDKENNISVQS
jgi:hypothetical protein